MKHNDVCLVHMRHQVIENILLQFQNLDIHLLKRKNELFIYFTYGPLENAWILPLIHQLIFDNQHNCICLMIYFKFILGKWIQIHSTEKTTFTCIAIHIVSKGHSPHLQNACVFQAHPLFEHHLCPHLLCWISGVFPLNMWPTSSWEANEKNDIYFTQSGRSCYFDWK